MIPRALTIAGSDSSGGAGVQADLKTFTVFRVYGMSAITALTAQNTRGVTGILEVPAAFVRAQVDAVANDVGIDAVKTGMLANADIVRTVAAALRDHGCRSVVVDPVMLAQSGAALLAADAREAVVAELLPLATLLTPNLPEAEALLGARILSEDDMREAARQLVRRGARACLLKGGHRERGDAVDVFDDGTDVRLLRAPRIDTRDTHGTGCQLSAAITAGLAAGLPLWEAVQQGKSFITRAIAGSLRLGSGCGPANPLAWLDES